MLTDLERITGKSCWEIGSELGRIRKEDVGFPDSPVVQTLSFQHSMHGFNPQWGKFRMLQGQTKRTWSARAVEVKPCGNVSLYTTYHTTSTGLAQ